VVDHEALLTAGEHRIVTHLDDRELTERVTGPV
jgi:hypothetical protein